MSNRHSNEPAQFPSPDEISRACRKIREGWSEKEHRRRAGVSMVAYVLSPISERVFDIGHGRG